MLSAATKCGLKAKDESHTETRTGEPTMSTSVIHFEEKVEEKTIQAEQSAVTEALEELSTIELAYVGGGTASVIFY
jgi:hypothetical protein